MADEWQLDSAVFAKVESRMVLMGMRPRAKRERLNISGISGTLAHMGSSPMLDINFGSRERWTLNRLLSGTFRVRVSGEPPIRARGGRFLRLSYKQSRQISAQKQVRVLTRAPFFKG